MVLMIFKISFYYIPVGKIIKRVTGVIGLPPMVFAQFVLVTQGL